MKQNIEFERPITLPLQKEFKKIGDTFTQIGYNPDTGMYLYRREQPTGAVYYEVFERRINKRFNCESYPGDESFGRWARCCRRLEDAERYFNNGLNKPIPVLRSEKLATSSPSVVSMYP